jgi:ketosteroid isomerase-like protein
MRLLPLIAALLLSLPAFSQSSEEAAIRRLLTLQTEAWNRGNIDAFMQTYWKSDSLMFIGSKGVVRGWQQTLDNYKKGYPDTAAMGQLSFDIIQVKPVSKEYAFVVGKWMLKRSMGDLSGHYTLVLRKIRGEWKIVADHSS